MSSLPIQGKQYIIQPGDTLQKIAVRAYGDAMKWSKIHRANPSIKSADLIRIGDILYIPPEEEIAAAKETAKASRFSGREKGTFTLVIDGHEIPVKNGRFKCGMDLLCSSWVADIAWTPGADSWLDARIRPYSYAPSELYLGSTLVGTGKLYGVAPKRTKDSRTKSLEFFSSTADLVDSTMRPPYEFSGVTLKQIAADLCGDLGYQLVFDIPAGPKFDTVTAKKTETVGAFLQRLATQRGTLCACDERSRVVFIRSITTGKPVATLDEDAPPITEWSARFDGRERFNVYRAVGQSGDGEDIEATAKDPAVPGTRQLTFSHSDSDAGSINTGAEWKRSKAIADALTIPFPVSDWYDPSGNLWRANTLVTIKAPSIDAPKPFDFLIRSPEFIFAPEGRQAILGVVPPGALAGGDVKEPWL
ncbi:MAG: LysM peptidoglycan-binding domain-containing protein [Spirochaetes bacterium]|nr:LysM peptidoglycan-binding domain-containing protein [Spirochaetota bacterium]